LGAVGGLLGLSGGVNGTGFASPQAANITNPVTGQQIIQGYNQAQTALGQQAAFAQAVQPGGLAALQSQQQLLSQLQAGAQGQGPYPALAQLQQTTGQNVANQAALMTGQRGASQNAGLIARQAAQQGAATQQQAAGQAAMMSAQQQIAYMQALQAQQAQLVGQQQQAIGANTQATQGEQGQLLGAQAAYNSAQVGSQSSQNAANAALAGQTMQGQQGLVGGLMNAAGPIASGVSKLFGAGGGRVKMASGGQYDQNFQGMSDDQWNALAANPNSMPPTQTPTPPNSTAIQTPAVTSVPTKPPPSKFATFLKTATQPQSQNAQQSSTSTPNFGNPGVNALYQGVSQAGKDFGNWLSKQSQSQSQSQSSPNTPINNDQAGGPSDTTSNASTSPGTDLSSDNGPQMNAAKGGKVPAMVSPGEKYLKPDDVKKVKKGANPMKVGETIPGEPKVKGAVNSYENDTVPKDLDEGGIVIPRSITQGPNPHWESMKFVHATMAKNRHKAKK
jgi:hypothetical protein